MEDIRDTHQKTELIDEGTEFMKKVENFGKNQNKHHELECNKHDETIVQVDEEAQIQNEETVNYEKYEEVIHKMLEVLNTIDQISSAYKNTAEHQLVAEQLDKVADIAIQQIKTVGIEEVPVYGQEIDGEYMESFGVARHITDDSLKPHEVAIVQRRAFKKVETGKIIQHALVYTVPGEV